MFVLSVDRRGAGEGPARENTPNYLEILHEAVCVLSF